jgi:hypothetical protein
MRICLIENQLILNKFKRQFVFSKLPFLILVFCYVPETVENSPGYSQARTICVPGLPLVAFFVSIYSNTDMSLGIAASFWGKISPAGVQGYLLIFNFRKELKNGFLHRPKNCVMNVLSLLAGAGDFFLACRC